jgi:hypothetical protein
LIPCHAFEEQAMKYDATDKTFVGDLSSSPLKKVPYDTPVGTILWHGIELIIEGTGGSVATFVAVDDDHDDRGDLMAVYLMPTPDTINRLPQLEGTAMILFND